MRRRDLIKAVAGSAIAWPLAARAQRPERRRRVAVLMSGLSSGDPGEQAEADALQEGLTELGWKLGGNIDLDYPVQPPSTARAICHPPKLERD